jgi:hypothetical protein
MTELTGTLRPVKQLRDARSAADVEPIGDITASVRYIEHQDMGIVEVLDEAIVPYVKGADGFALFTQGGELLSWWNLMIRHPGDELRLAPGGGFAFAVDAAGSAAREHATTAGG